MFDNALIKALVNNQSILMIPRILAGIPALHDALFAFSLVDSLPFNFFLELFLLNILR